MLPLVTNRKTPDREIWGSFKVHVHFTCIFLSFLGLRSVWSESVSGCFYCRCPVAVLSKVVELAGVEPASEISTSLGFANPVESRISPNSVELSIPDFTSWIPARNANLLNSTISVQNQRPAFFIMRALSSCHSRSFRSVRLSCCFLPFATPTFTLHQAFFQYSDRATTVKPSRLIRP